MSKKNLHGDGWTLTYQNPRDGEGVALTECCDAPPVERGDEEFCPVCGTRVYDPTELLMELGL